MKKVSIIIPVYNVSKYLRRCLDSIVNQNYEDYELILVDDGSTDGSSSICDEYHLKYPTKVKVIHQINSGVSASRNRGIEASSGKYIVFIDADDQLTSEFSDAICLLDEDTDLYCFTHDEINERDKVISLGSNDGLIGEYTSIFDFTNPDEYTTVDNDFFVQSSWAKIYKRDTIGNARFNENLKLGEDSLWNLELSIKKLKTIRTSIYRYRIRKGSLSRNGNNCTPKDAFIFCQQFEKFYLSKFEPTQRFYMTLLTYLSKSIYIYIYIMKKLIKMI